MDETQRQGRRTHGTVFLAALSCALGLGVGIAVWALLSAAYAACDLVWDVGRGFLDVPWFPLAACTLGGLAIGLWNARFDCAPKPLDAVMAEVRRTGGYSVGPVLPSSVSFLLPIAFGGSVGPEAGLTGLIATGCTWVGAKLRRASNDSGLSSRARKTLVYAFGVLGGIGGVALYTALFGGGMPIPRFDPVPYEIQTIIWTLPLALAGFALALLYEGATRLARRLASALEAHPVVRPLLCGIALGATALVLPLVLFPGGQQATDLAQGWTGLSPAVLLATGLVKVAFIALCLNLGWNGGPFFPLIFGGVAFGFGIAGATGIDPALCVTVVTTALIAGFTRKAPMTLLIMLLCFPMQSLPWMGAAVAVGVLLPKPGASRPSTELRRPSQ